ncbi:acetylornithine deacetylase [Rhodoligotrophos appendicifer]|uniref:ArgE/DapE family deacylase n=1 Tax=Rhodoligotrophos appendicifer TaxID=987056 RepID=UPI001FEB20CC|nr:ArgE/DapE family deacylase [Rhodoligotrophos appendicifer]
MSELSLRQIDDIIAAVDGGFDRQIALLAELVGQASLRGHEAGVQAVVEREMGRLGLEIDRFRIDLEAAAGQPGFSPATVDYTNAWNLAGYRRSGRDGGRSLALNGHVDVVPTANPALWSHGPYSAVVEGDWMYGRGAGDMKAGVTANLFALAALDMAGITLLGDVHIQSVIEEEITGNGAAMALARGHVADAILIPEPTDEQLVRANVGVIKFAITLRGVPAHPREIGAGTSAIEAGFAMVARLKDLEAHWIAEKAKHPHFAALRNPVALTIGKFNGGEWSASVSTECRMEGRIGIYPGDDPTLRVREFESFVAACALEDPALSRAEPRVEWVGHVHGGYELAPGGEAESMLGWAHGITNDRPLPAYVMPAYLDAAVFALHAGMPAITYGPVAERVHGIDERVSLSSLRRVTKTIALFIAGWCGVANTDR